MESREKGSRTEYSGESHEMVLTNRQKLAMSGVLEVVSFNEKQVQLGTAHGPLMIGGEDLNIQQLNLENGRLVIEGMITSFSYNLKGRKSLINRVFK